LDSPSLIYLRLLPNKLILMDLITCLMERIVKIDSIAPEAPNV
jgi:hypothetical protein